MTNGMTDLSEAARALEALANGPASAAADALATAFDAAGERISASLGEAARSGELDFKRMADAVLREIARVAAEAVVSRGQTGSGLSAHFNFTPGTDERAALAQGGALAALLARLVQGGGRFL
jgi:ribose 5-phosphate isomerase RpiB